MFGKKVPKKEELKDYVYTESIHGRYIGKFKQKPVNETNRDIK